MVNVELGKILIYQNEKGDTKIDVFFAEDTIWITQKNLAELYQVTVKTINEHIINIISEGELEESATIRKFRIVQNEGLSPCIWTMLKIRRNAKRPCIWLTGKRS
jgi:hypothetical protein